MVTTRILPWLAALAVLPAACSATQGEPVNLERLGYRQCTGYFDCGPGRFCRRIDDQLGFCSAECRSSADCREVCLQGRCNLSGQPCDDDGDCSRDKICNRYGQCLEPDGGRQCTSHQDCGEMRFCNGACTISGASCGSSTDCPYFSSAGEECQGSCGAHCGNDNDCLAWGENLSCTPVGQCLQPGWEKWIPPGELPPTDCTSDDQCQALGFAYFCDCDKEPQEKTGRPVCSGGTSSVCVKSDAPLDFGPGPASSPAHAFAGVWGMRMEIAVVTVGLPLVNRQNTYSANLFLVKIDHLEDDRLLLREKLCEIRLINFIDSDEPFDDLAWMLIPAAYLRSLPVLEQTVEVSSAAPGSSFETSQSVEVRGCVLDDPLNDPLPDRHDYDADPNDPRFIDQDGDGHVGMTTLMDGVLRGQIYNVQRWKAVYHGEILDADHVRGLSTVENEQLVISASNPTLIYDTTTEIHAEADRTYFRLMRLPDDASCADLIRAARHQDSWLRHTPHLMDVADP
ncbi:MAG: hypothetical protein DRI34_01855 [Deltaproteobacteria bacterium]|nr:MAG: hypothetical protein DRI34_01855 [Deltaproteobacteria bacterium]